MNLRRKGAHLIIAEILLLSIIVVLSSIAANYIIKTSKESGIAIYKKGEQEIACREKTSWNILSVNDKNVTIRNNGPSDIKLSQLKVYVRDALALERGTEIKVASYSKELLKQKEKGNITLEINPYSTGRSYLVVEDPCGVKDIYLLSPVTLPSMPPMPLTCWIEETGEGNPCSSGKCIFALSSFTNAHIEDCSKGNYKYKLCCQNVSDVAIFPNGSTCPIGYTGFITISSFTNALAEEYGYNKPDGFPEKNNVCVKLLDMGQGIYTTLSDCISLGGIPIFSLSSETNAHVGNFTQYSIVFCYKQSS